MTAEERLFCRCGVEVRVVRLGKSLLTLGHLQNPKHKHHPVRLAAPRPEQDTRVWDEDAVGPARTGAPRTLVVPAPRKRPASPAGAGVGVRDGGSHLPPRKPRRGASMAGDRTPLASVPDANLRPLHSSPPLEARRRGAAPPRSAPRLQPSVGRSTAGETGG